ncbi:DUF4965 domain-containing protein [Chitinophaga sp. SYP-B3965]|uniref:glutaminase family protein n=1 Tax=Chitinophaga sp. SYP-B3965 TaxID=2663120 RepID=UPI001299759E|nr:glutaminase family protein [Chitinophaga sp. SYP-B3965]MRG43594.1 DUF4965 domain-containing protein [Chitinophaga sp. SYP-B3965]
MTVLAQHFRLAVILVCSSLLSMACLAQEQKAPSYPLITHTPYFSIWSSSDKLNGSVTKHWTGADHSLVGIIKVDDTYYRFLGKETNEFITVLPAADETAYEVAYTLSNPGSGWFETGFNDKEWKTGGAPFSDDRRKAKTRWNTDDLWVRRTFTLGNDVNFDNLFLKINHDDNIDIYLNGKPIYHKEGWVNNYTFLDLQEQLKTNLKTGKNVLAFHVRNTAGGRFLDAGIARKIETTDSKLIREAAQKNVEVKAMETKYSFSCGKVDLELTFTSPLLLKDLALLSTPVSYISYQVKSNDGNKHQVSVLLSASTDIAANQPTQQMTAKATATGGIKLLQTGTVEQPVLMKKGDDIRIDWGYFYVGASKDYSQQYIAANEKTGISQFLKGQYKGQTETTGKRLSLNTVVSFGQVGATPIEKFMMLGYDEVYAVQYFGTNLRPWWNKNGDRNFSTLMNTAAVNYNTVIKKAKLFQDTIYTDALKTGGAAYAQLCELAYRQSIAAHGLVESPQKELLFLSKENFSNGCIATVDLTYPSAPLYLAYNPELEKGMMNGIFYYSESGKWTKPFAAHDLGTYPLANGQVYGEDMPVEEAGNMVILAAAIAKAEGNAGYAKQHWATLTTWAKYLDKEGFDPANQLCTDDFAGHLARNVNLSAKAIMALRSYSFLAGMLGHTADAKYYLDRSRSMMENWIKLADDGDHFSLAFEKKDSWSQKYNLVWDKVLDFNLFPKSVFEKEISFYLTKQKTYGLPLDSRKTYTKSDWIIWTAVLTKNNTEFEKFILPLQKYALETTSRVPLGDWHETTNGKQVGFQARSVVGGYFMKVLNDKLNK